MIGDAVGETRRRFLYLPLIPANAGTHPPERWRIRMGAFKTFEGLISALLGATEITRMDPGIRRDER